MLACRTQPEVISNEKLQRYEQEKLVTVKLKLWKWKRHTEEVFLCHRQKIL
jgi:hypothetical protein